MVLLRIGLGSFGFYQRFLGLHHLVLWSFQLFAHGELLRQLLNSDGDLLS